MITSRFLSKVRLLLLRPAGAVAVAAFALTFIVETASAGQNVFWSKSFAPDTIGPGSVSTLTFVINNNSPFGVRNVQFTDQLPAGMTIASPANVTIDCDGTLNAPDGGNTITLMDGEVPGSGSCTITVDVTSSTIGSHRNQTGLLTSDAGNSGSTSATLMVVEELPGFSKAFNPASVGLGARTTLTFTIDNSANEGSRNNLRFTDNLPLGMVVADPANGSTTCTGGLVTAVPGSSVISFAPEFFSQGSVGAFQTCTVSVDVIATSTGSLHNVTGELTSSTLQGGTEVSSGKASATLQVSADPLVLTKSFTNDPVPPGSIVNLEFTITNRSRDFPATGIAFTDNLSNVLPGLVAVGTPLNNVCGAGSTLSGSGIIRLSDGNLEAGETCTFTVPVLVPVSAGGGAFPNSTSTVTGTVDGSPVSGPAANDTLFVAAAPRLEMVFLNSPVTPGGTTTLRYTVTNTSVSDTATEIQFENELPAVLSNIVEFPASGFCGATSTMQFTPASPFDPARLIISSGNLGPLQSCSFDVIIDVAPDASNGLVTNGAGPVTATVGNNSETGNSASADLAIVSAPQLTKTFLNDPVSPGGLVELEYTLTHSAEVNFPATDITFSDDLRAVIPGMVAIDLPVNNACGPGSLLRGTSVVTLTGGRLNPGQSCTMRVKVQIPQDAPLGIVTNTTTPVLARVGGIDVMSAPASDDLLVSTLSVTKQFLDDPVVPGGTVTLRFTITNAGPVDASGIVFTDDLDDAVNGLTALGLPRGRICGTNSTLSGASGDTLLIFQDGFVRANTSCSFDVLLQVPASTPDGQYINVTSGVTAQVGKLMTVVPAASDVLVVDSIRLQLTKIFLTNPVEAGSSTALEFTLTNLSLSQGISGISFTDTLAAGMTNTGGTISNPCGPGSSLSGTTTLTFTGGSLGPGASCTFSVPISVSSEAVAGSYPNMTSDVSGVQNSLAVRGDAASADLLVTAPAIDLEDVIMTRIGDGNMRFDFAATPGRRYCILWSSDLFVWNKVDRIILAESELETWIDGGLPDTPTAPNISPARFYRITEIQE